MPSVDPRAASIIAILTEFEQSVNAAESALVVRDWPQIDALLSDQHRLTHGLKNALEATRDVRPQTFTDEVNRRLRRISDQRADQLRRLIAFNTLVKERLAVISRTREMRRLHVEAPRPRLLDTLR